MSKQSVYLETSAIGYGTSRPSRDLVVAAHQRITRDWFSGGAQTYDLFVSQLVIREVQSGDREAADERLAFLEDIPLLAATDAAARLAEALVSDGVVPETAGEDALHIAIAAVHGVDYLVTWNCRHIANATMRSGIERVCREAGYEPPVICTPEELIGDEDE